MRRSWDSTRLWPVRRARWPPSARLIVVVSPEKENVSAGSRAGASARHAPAASSAMRLLRLVDIASLHRAREPDLAPAEIAGEAAAAERGAVVLADDHLLGRGRGELLRLVLPVQGLRAHVAFLRGRMH